MDYRIIKPTMYSSQALELRVYESKKVEVIYSARRSHLFSRNWPADSCWHEESQEISLEELKELHRVTGMLIEKLEAEDESPM